ncbi:hypothetical protein HDU91_000827 [Kappamyces sp. JEL0680]|nr:hypothetical protein HDU91_000827 [Kappamyces sp. JEL0680]
MLSLKAMKWAMEHLMDKKRDNIILMNSRSYAPSADFALLIDKSFQEKYQADQRKKAHDLLNARAKQLHDQGFSVKALACSGANPVVELEKQIQRITPTMVVMASHNRNDFSRILLGTWSNHLIHHLQDIPVFLVPLAFLETV